MLQSSRELLYTLSKSRLCPALLLLQVPNEHLSVNSLVCPSAETDSPNA